jgi:heme/copper-type cytochrome/quinol oxidase subunit 3
LILLTSGATITYAHHAITAGNKIEAVWGMVLTVVLAILFTALQAFEYVSASFTITDSIFGSTFFMATGFHGFHGAPSRVSFFVLVTKCYWNRTLKILERVEIYRSFKGLNITCKPFSIKQLVLFVSKRFYVIAAR